MTDICAGCEGDETCQIQDDMRSSKYGCLIPQRFNELKEKIEAIKKYVDHIEYGSHVIRQPDVAEASKMIAQRLREILEAED